MKQSFTFLTLVGIACLAPTSHAQVLFSAGTYTQNFDSLANSGTANTWTDNSTLPGWYASKSTSGAVTAYRAGTGSDVAGSIYSFGAASSAERALGSVGANSVGSFAYGVRFTNDTSQTITNITVSYTGEQWRNGGNTAVQTNAFSYFISNSPILTSDAGNANAWVHVSALDFNTPTVGSTAAALDGNAAANRHVFANVPLSGVSVSPGQEIFLRWFDLNDPSNDHAVAVDDLTVSFTSVTSVINPPAITGEPQSRTNNAGTTATFTVTATGTALNYQWMKEGNDMSDGGNISGTTTPTLTITNVSTADTAGYTVRVFNGVNSVTSQPPAVLTVLDPGINTQPLSRTNLVGDTANFFVQVAGTAPFTYQWLFNGGPIADATVASLNATNVQSTNQGLYSVIVSNALGNSSTSSPANLTLLATPSIRIAEWNFNSTNSLLAAAPASSVGSGTGSLVNGTSGAFASGSFSDPASPPGPDNSGWNVTSFPPQGTSNKTAGVQFNVSTLGYQNLLITWEERHSPTASKYTRLQYTVDGTNFVDAKMLAMNATDSSFVFFSDNLSGVSGINDNTNFAFRIVTEWESTAIGSANNLYDGTSSAYGTAGTMRFDLVNVFGDALSSVSPIPLTIRQDGNNVVLTWSNPAFILQSASIVTGPYADITGSTSPYTNAVSGSQQFFRLKH